MTGQKKCTRCKEYKYVGNFSRDRTRHDGLSARCRACDTALARERYQKPAVREKRIRQTLEWCKKRRSARDPKFMARRRRERANRRAAEKAAIPVWANLEAIAGIYMAAVIWNRNNPSRPVHVDHIVPLKGKTVCGLHVENNLQLLPVRMNLSKNRHTWPGKP